MVHVSVPLHLGTAANKAMPTNFSVLGADVLLNCVTFTVVLVNALEEVSVRASTYACPTVRASSDNISFTRLVHKSIA